MELTQGSKMMEFESNQHWQNYKFIRFVVEKYSTGMKQLTEIQEKTDTVEVKSLQKELISSLSEDLLQRGQSCNDSAVEKLSSRINNLYQEIMTFRNDTLKEHEEHRR